MTATLAAVAADRKTAYLQHGTPIDGDLSIADSLAAAGLDWEVEKVPAKDLQPDGTVVDVPGRFNVRRKTDLRVFDVVGATYEPVNNVDALGIGDDLRQEAGAKFVATGTIAEGRGVWVAFELPEGLKVGGEDSYGLTGLLETTHDGKRAVRMHIAPVRFQCTNVMNMMVRGAVQRFSIHHTSKAKERLLEAQVAVGLVDEYRAKYLEAGERLLKVDLAGEDLAAFLDKLVPERKKKADEVAAIRSLAEASPTNEFGRGTAYAAVNAVREYYDHVRPQRTSESAFIGAYVGVNAKMTNRALSMLDRG